MPQEAIKLSSENVFYEENCKQIHFLQRIILIENI